jgi:hypothetical protein
VGDNSSKKTLVTANICIGCCDMTDGGDPQKTHYCREAAEKGISNGLVGPMIVTFPRGDKCRNNLCTVRKAAGKNQAA